MKKLLKLFVLLPILSWAQPFDFSSKSFDFQSVYYSNADSLKLTLTNTSGFDIDVTGFAFFALYDFKPFYVKDSVFTLQPGEQHDVWLYFEPEQNVAHDMVAVVKTDFRGDYVIDLFGKGKFLNPYYNSTYDKDEQLLKNALKTILSSGAVDLGYSGARDKMFMDIDNQKVNGQGASQNTIECVYTGQQVVGYISRVDVQNQGFNTEHTFPQGFFNSNVPMRSDLHHLFPTNANANSQRGNLPFGIVTGTPSWSQGGSKKGNGVFEPRDVQKGRVARALFYFVVRYQDYSNHVQGQESILRQWLNQYPPTAVDIKRNDDIFSVQKNRNPFVDYPQFVKRITRVSGNSTAPQTKSLYVSRDTVDMRFQKDSLVYSISVVNNGYGMVTLSDFAISDTANFRIVFPTSSVPNVTIPPGKGFEIKIRAVPESFKTVTEHLTFTTGIATNPSVDVVLLGEWGSVSVKEQYAGTPPQIYPNPVAGTVSISWGNHPSYRVSVFSVQGSLVYSQNVYSIVSQIDVSQFPAGMYVVRFSADDEVVHRSLVKK